MIAKLSEKFNTRTLVLTISGFLMLGEAYAYNFPAISTIAFLVYILTLGKAIGERISEKKDIQWWTGIAITLSTISLVGVIAYYPYRLTTEFSMLAVFFSFGLALQLYSALQARCSCHLNNSLFKLCDLV